MRASRHELDRNAIAATAETRSEASSAMATAELEHWLGGAAPTVAAELEHQVAVSSAATSEIEHQVGGAPQQAQSVTSSDPDRIRCGTAIEANLQCLTLGAIVHASILAVPGSQSYCAPCPDPE